MFVLLMSLKRLTQREHKAHLYSSLSSGLSQTSKNTCELSPLWQTGSSKTVCCIALSHDCEPECRLDSLQRLLSILKSAPNPCRPVEENTEFLEDLAKASKGKGVVLMCEAGGTTKPSPNFAAGKASRSLKVRSLKVSFWAVLQAAPLCDLLIIRVGRGGPDMLLASRTKNQPYIVAGYMHIPFDGTIWRGEHLSA